MKILVKPWTEAQADAFPVRQAVFVEEQGVPLDLELDEFDPGATHVLAYQEARCIGTGRLVDLGNGVAQIGRMAVLSEYRGLGIGQQILERLIAQAQSWGAQTILLHAQIAAMSFYEKVGFEARGPIYEEAGIAHRNMILLLPN